MKAFDMSIVNHLENNRVIGSEFKKFLFFWTWLQRQEGWNTESALAFTISIIRNGYNSLDEYFSSSSCVVPESWQEKFLEYFEQFKTEPLEICDPVKR